MTQIQLYNSLTQSKQIFTPIEAGRVGLYSCGPTVYDRVHIGNLRAFITADTLQRVLREIGGYSVDWVMNITDIDDKMIIRANQRYPDLPPKTALKRLSGEYSQLFLTDLERVGIEQDAISTQPYATTHINEMQAMIRQLVNDDVAYVVDGSVYFSLSHYADSGQRYGKLVDVHYDSQTRIDDQDQKAGVGDFALWKAAKPAEPSWDFELSGQSLPGRPGWHIECSAMSTKYLGHKFDIHTGGVDLKFPHHENEIAQNGGELANYWLHNEFLNVESAKMSKSLGNFLTLEAVADPLAFRLFILSGHYRTQMDFSEAALSAAHNRRQGLRQWISRLLNNPLPAGQPNKEMTVRYDQALSDDLNTPAALAVVAEVVSQPANQATLEFAHHIDSTLGLGLFADQSIIKQDPELKQILNDRDQARQNQDFNASDALREQLRERNVGVDDTADGQVVWQIT